MLPTNTNSAQMLNFFPVLHIPNSPFMTSYLVHFPNIYLVFSLFYQKDERALRGKLKSSKLFCLPLPRTYNARGVSYYISPFLFSLSVFKQLIRTII